MPIENLPDLPDRGISKDLLESQEREIAAANKLLETRDAVEAKKKEVEELRFQFLAAIHYAHLFEEFSLKDIALILDCSRQRASQLLKDYDAEVTRRNRRAKTEPTFSEMLEAYNAANRLPDQSE